MVNDLTSCPAVLFVFDKTRQLIAIKIGPYGSDNTGK